MHLIIFAQISDLYLYGARICCFSALYTDFPALIGCSEKYECLCLAHESCCKLATPPYPIEFKQGNNGNICGSCIFC